MRLKERDARGARDNREAGPRSDDVLRALLSGDHLPPFYPLRPPGGRPGHAECSLGGHSFVRSGAYHRAHHPWRPAEQQGDEAIGLMERGTRVAAWLPTAEPAQLGAQPRVIRLGEDGCRGVVRSDRLRVAEGSLQRLLEHSPLGSGASSGEQHLRNSGSATEWLSDRKALPLLACRQPLRLRPGLRVLVPRVRRRGAQSGGMEGRLCELVPGDVALSGQRALLRLPTPRRARTHLVPWVQRRGLLDWLDRGCTVPFGTPQLALPPSLETFAILERQG